MAEGTGRRRRKATRRRKVTTRGTAPSSPDIESLDKMEASEEAKRHEPSDVDAMGQDKRRQVIGHAYGPSRRSQLLFFVAAGAAIVIVIGGWLLAVSVFDQPEDSYADKAPWSDPATPQNAASNSPDEFRTPSPGNPCGEPGNPYPPSEGSACAELAGAPE